jgi:molybdate transport system ATP-binding protein
VALARALARRPRLLLLDEPFSALDPGLRDRLRSDLRRIQKEHGLVVVCVTHNLEDAFAVGDRLAVVQEGEIAEVGRVEEVFRRPKSIHAAEVLGVRNLFHARVLEAEANHLALDWDGLVLTVPAQPASPGEVLPVYVAPQDIKLLYPDRPLSRGLVANQIRAEVAVTEVRSGTRTIRLELENGHEVEVRGPAYVYEELDLRPGSWVRISMREESIVVLREIAEPLAEEGAAG